MVINVLDKQQTDFQQFIYSLSHDMGAPLRAVVQFSQMLDSQLAEKLDPKERYWLELINQNGRRAQDMIEGLLAYSRLTTQKPFTSQFSFNELLSLVAKQVGANFKAQQAQFHFPTENHRYTGPLEHWELFFHSVLKNALFYQPNTLGHTPQVVVEIDQADDKLTISIHDNGIGVDPSKFNELVKPYRRLNAEKEYPNGLGMGLTHCERIIDLLDGDLQFSQSHMGGLCVTCTVPNALADISDTNLQSDEFVE